MPTFRLVDAVARGLSPEDPVLGGIERLRAPLTLSIRGVIADVDGTLTDGGVTFADQPDSARTFSTRDGLGTHLLVQAGIKVGWLSATSSGVSIRQRAAQLKLEHVDAAEGPKGPRFLALCAAMNLPPQDVAYLGDDVNDLPAMRLAGLAACPCDAHSSVRNQVGLVLDAPGGRGAFRELADLILAGLSSS